jgi:hypothetical protein
MTKFKEGDRIVVQQDEYKDQHGKIVKEIVSGGWNEYEVKLDNGVNDKFRGFHIKHEDLNSNEISALIKNIKEEIEHTSRLEQEMKTELPTHIGYVEDALTSNNKSRAEIEYTYVKSNLERLSKEENSLQDWMESIRIDFDKIDWAVKRLQFK